MRLQHAELDVLHRVSIHAPRCRGAMQLTHHGLTARPWVSIHAPRCRGAMQLTHHGLTARPWVSIHAPRCRGAMPYFGSSVRQRTSVSIHAPRCRGAMPCVARVALSTVKVSIHAPRCRGAMRGGTWTKPTAFTPFQSTPPVAGGRCLAGITLDFGSLGFNPRPPLPGGDAGGVIARRLTDHRVSIHAPRCRGAMRRAARMDAHADGSCFNPRPPLPGGDAAPGVRPVA